MSALISSHKAPQSFEMIGTSENARRIYSNLTLSLPPSVFVREAARHQNDDTRLKMNAKKRSVSMRIK